MDDQLYNELNTLAAFLRDFHVVELVRQHYAKYGNDAPPSLLESQIKILQDRLDQRYEDKKDTPTVQAQDTPT